MFWKSEHLNKKPLNSGIFWGFQEKRMHFQQNKVHL